MGKKLEILLVEDNPSDVELTLRALKKKNIVNSVTIARDGAEALELLFGSDDPSAAAPPDAPALILLDLKMPKVDGLEVLRRIKGDPRTRRIPVVMLTSSREDVDLAKCYDLGVNSYIVKPVDFDQFMNAVAEVGLYWMLLNERQPAHIPPTMPSR